MHQSREQGRGGGSGRLALSWLVGLVWLLPMLAGCGGAPANDPGEPGPAPAATAVVDTAPDTAPGAASGAIIETTSLLGEPLARPEVDGDFEEQQEALLAEAEAALAADPASLDALIWVGRRTAYLGRFRDAVAIYGRGLESRPGEPWLLRHRGHRHLTLRQLEAAIADLALAAERVEGQADEVEPDGLPNALGIPTSTLHTNIWYHLGLAHYLEGDWAVAEAAYRRCFEAAENDDMRVAAAYWLYLALRRQGRDDEALRLIEPFGPGVELVENTDYHRLILVFRGDTEAAPLLAEARELGGGAFATLGYGLAAWHGLEGRAEDADTLLREIVDGESWPSFGHLASEADLAR